MSPPYPEAVARAAEAVGAWLGPDRPRVALVLGSGLGGLADRLEDARRLPYASIPGFPMPTVEGHAGELAVGRLEGVLVLAQRGRFHLYEGHDGPTAVLPVRAFARLGVEVLVVTNAAGGVNPAFGAGTLMLIRDHLNLTGRNPLVGPALPGETRFPDMTAPYDAALRAAAHGVATASGIPLAEGVYAGLLGPSYETPAEVRMLRGLGADAVGMSTVLEVIAARAAGLRCVGISIITNAAAGLGAGLLTHDEVVATADRAGRQLGDLVAGVVREAVGR